MPKKKETAGMTVREAGRKGGETTAGRYGHEFYEEIGKKGGQRGGPRVRELIQKGKQQAR
jgi:general stress protein YciG